MKSNRTKDFSNLLKSIFFAHFILVLHVFLIAGLGFLVLFFRGVVFYLPWIFLAGSVAILATGYFALKRMKRDGKSLSEALSLPSFPGRKVEISFFGGLASLKVESESNVKKLETHTMEPSRQIEDASTQYIRELTELVRMFENDLITLDEYNKAKQTLFNSCRN